MAGGGGKGGSEWAADHNEAQFPERRLEETAAAAHAGFAKACREARHGEVGDAAGGRGGMGAERQGERLGSCAAMDNQVEAAGGKEKPQDEGRRGRRDRAKDA